MPIQPWNKELYEAGLAVRKKVLGAQYVDPNIEKAENDPFTAKIQTMVTEYCWGGAWTNDTLDHKTRSLMNLCILTALGKDAGTESAYAGRDYQWLHGRRDFGSARPCDGLLRYSGRRGCVSERT